MTFSHKSSQKYLLFDFSAKRRIFANHSKNITLSLFHNGQFKKNRNILRWAVTELAGDFYIFTSHFQQRMRR